MFEKNKIKALMGGFFSLTTLASSLILVPTETTYAAVYPSVSEGEVTIETNKSFSSPLPDYTGISQFYHFGHWGIDLTAPIGSKIYPIKKGKVVKILNLRWDYGRAVFVEHDNEMISLYAHMGKITVSEGEEVTPETSLGEVGMSGKTTGPHLHLEVHKGNKALNPLPYLDLGEPNRR